MQDFYIGNNLIFTPHRIAAVFSLEPIDLIILPEQAQTIFELDIRNTLHALQEGAIEVMIRTRKAVPEDFKRHFDSLQRGQQLSNYSLLVKGYIEQLSELLEENMIPIKEYFIVFSIGVNTRERQRVSKAIDNLSRQIERIGGNLKQAGIVISQVEGLELEKLMSQFTRL